jgi:hypothetical protein
MRNTYLLLIVIFLNCISVSNLRIDTESPSFDKDNYYYIEDKLGEGRPYSFRNLMEQISKKNRNMIEVVSKDDLAKVNSYYKLYVKHIENPTVWESLLLYLSAITFTIVPSESSAKVQYNIQKIENGEVVKSYKYSYDLSFCMSLFSLNCKLFNEKPYTSAYFAKNRLNQEVNRPIADTFGGD